MKRYLHLFIVTVALVAMSVSCARKEPMPINGIPGESRVLTVLCGQGADASRTEINEYTPVWNSGDALWVSDGVNSARVTVPAEFAGKNYAELTIPGSLRADTTLWFLYPYDDEASVVGGRIVASIPISQNGIFGDAHLAVGTCAADATSVSLKNASAILKLTVDREDLRVMQLTSNTAFTGSFRINPETGAKYSNNNALKTIVMNFSGKGDKYLSCMGTVSLPKGTHFSFVTHDGRVGGISTSTSNSLANGSLYDLGEIDDLIELDENPAVTLGQHETANCYIINEAGTYRLPAVQGNSKTSIGEAVYGEVVWETVNTTTSPTKYSVVSDVVYSDGYLYFRIPSPIKAGNALVAACDGTGKVLWSWHIWLLPEGYEDQTYAAGDPNPYSGAVMMDRNLGALSTIAGNVSSYGLLYQWGRKDPFTGIASGTSTSVKVAGTSITTIAQNTDNGTMEYAIANPTKVVYKSSGDWLVNSDASLWSAKAKTIYDPCPEGYHVPYSDALSGLTISNTTWDATAKGRTITIDGQVIWYPATGTRASGSGALQNGGSTSFGWFDKSTTAGQNAWKFSSDTIGIMPKQQPQAACFSVRCQKYVVTGDEQTLTIGVTLGAGDTFLSPYLTADTYSSAKIYWGDESEEPLGMEDFLRHLYSAAGNYSIIVKGYSVSGFKLKSLGDITSIDVSGF